MKKFLALILLSGLFALSFGESKAFAQGNILVAYFSRTGEEYNVGNITKGNTHIIAEIIARKTGGTLFEIKPVKSYPVNYKECTKVASSEKAAKARPALANTVENFDGYDIIFVGFPIWYGDMPMPVYTFLESYDFGGKTIIPFCTHGGSGLSSTDQQITLTCPGAKLLQGFEIRGSVAQKDFNQAESKVVEWLKKIGMTN